ncbi:GrpB family protein [Longitalea luteola]|uniref:GrpB family protein n=1 Tax=Longitalea luteola TaxID=2812563 RepID=UPI001A978A77|nr:GrpB family protein [Longitalea luteola]
MKYKLSPEQAGITPHQVEIESYNPDWQLMAGEISARLANVLGENLTCVEHIGSTAVPGLAAKPVIDLIPVVNSLTQLDEQKQLVEELGYKWHGEFGIAGRRFCTYTNGAGKRLIHLHFFEKGFGAITRHLAFRDYLRAHPAVARQYEAEKRRAAQLHANDSLAYNDEKAAWVKHYEKEALNWYHLHTLQKE